MKIFELFWGLYTELKRLNENLESLSVFNEDTSVIRFLKQIAAAADAYGDEKLRKARLNPLTDMTPAEVIRLKAWIESQLGKKGIQIGMSGSHYKDRDIGDIEYFFSYNKSGTEFVRNTISAALGYDTFYDLVEDWRKAGRKAEGGAA
jgi:hypothetical protein